MSHFTAPNNSACIVSSILQINSLNRVLYDCQLWSDMHPWTCKHVGNRQRDDGQAWEQSLYILWTSTVSWVKVPLCNIVYVPGFPLMSFCLRWSKLLVSGSLLYGLAAWGQMKMIYFICSYLCLISCLPMKKRATEERIKILLIISPFSHIQFTLKPECQEAQMITSTVLTFSSGYALCSYGHLQGNILVDCSYTLTNSF